MKLFVNVLFAGIATGSIYSLIAIGLVLIFKSSGVIKFAQGSMVMLGAFLTYAFVTQLPIPVYLSLFLPLFISVVMAVIYGTSEGALSGIFATQLSWIEAYSFMLFVLIYTPCLSTIAVMKQESKSWLFTTLAVVWPLTLAWLVSFIYYQVATRLTA